MNQETLRQLRIHVFTTAYLSAYPNAKITRALEEADFAEKTIGDTFIGGLRGPMENLAHQLSNDSETRSKLLSGDEEYNQAVIELFSIFGHSIS